jgi:hypothetical protein
MFRRPRIPLPSGTRARLRVVDAPPAGYRHRWSGRDPRQTPRGEGSWSIIVLTFASVITIGSLLGHANSLWHLPAMLGADGQGTADRDGAVTYIRDGDTMEVAGIPVRFANLDCAEMDTAQGRAARSRIARAVSRTMSEHPS